VNGSSGTPWPSAFPIVFFAKASRGEERTFALLKKLPDDYLIYYEPTIDNRHPDFIVIAPDLGVIIIEVKGWYLDDILEGNHSEVTINTDGRERKEVHPLEQARNYMWRLFRACENSPSRSHLLRTEGPHKNKFFFPFCHFVVLSNISRDNILKRKDQNVAEIFKSDNTLFRDELVALENASAGEIRNTLMRFFDPFWPITPFTDQQVDVLRSIIHPEIVLSPLASRALTEGDVEKCFDLVVLDRRQENNARKIGEGHRIIYGVAGSGKTVLLIARAKWLLCSYPFIGSAIPWNPQVCKNGVKKRTYRTNCTLSISENSRSPVRKGIFNRFATEYPTQSIVDSFFPCPDASFLLAAPAQ